MIHLHQNPPTTTPKLNFKAFQNYISGHETEYIDASFITQGFPLWLIAEPTNLSQNHQHIANNIEQLNKIMETMVEEAEKGYIVPVPTPTQYQIVLFCAPKKPKPHQLRAWRVVRHGSYAHRDTTSINDWIDPFRSSMKDLPAPLPNLKSYARTFHGMQWLAGRDLKDAFRQILMAPNDANRIGYALCGLYFKDVRQPYGLRSAAANCQHFASIVIWIYETYKLPQHLKGQTNAYIDDYSMTAHTKEQINQMTSAFDKLLNELGIAQSPEKAIKPTQEAVIHGFLWNLQHQTVAIPEDKRRELERALSALILLRICTIRALESIIGKMMHWCQIHSAAKTLCHNSIHFIYHWIRSKKIPKYHYVILPMIIIQDFKFWINLIITHQPIPLNLILQQPSQCVYATTDASSTHAGILCGTDWWCYPFTQQMTNAHINAKEAHAILSLLYNKRHAFTGKQIHIELDNTTVYHGLRRKWSKSADIIPYIYEICLMAIRFHIIVWVDWIRSATNLLADALSRNDMKRFFNHIHLFIPDYPDHPFPHQPLPPLYMDTTKRLESTASYQKFITNCTQNDGPVQINWLSKREKRHYKRLLNASIDKETQLRHDHAPTKLNPNL